MICFVYLNSRRTFCFIVYHHRINNNNWCNWWTGTHCCSVVITPNDPKQKVEWWSESGAACETIKRKEKHFPPKQSQDLLERSLFDFAFILNETLHRRIQQEEEKNVCQPNGILCTEGIWWVKRMRQPKQKSSHFDVSV